jgi:dihydroneopterin aldolase
VASVFIRELPVTCIIGVHPDERASRQRLLISVELETDFTRAAATDALEQALDYTDIAARIDARAREGRFHLLETLAERLATELLQDPVTRVTVEIEKPAALPSTRQVGVRIRRSRT